MPAAIPTAAQIFAGREQLDLDGECSVLCRLRIANFEFGFAHHSFQRTGRATELGDGGRFVSGFSMEAAIA